MSRNKPYEYWDKVELDTILTSHVEKMLLGKKLETLITVLLSDAIYSEDWNVPLDFNGCSFVQDYRHPSLACLYHDWLNRTGRGGRMGDYVFYRLMLVEGMNKRKACTRWFFVRIGYLFYFKWKYDKQEPTQQMKNINEYFKNK